MFLFPSVMTTLCTGCFSLLAIIIGLLMIIDFIIEDLMLNSYLQKNFHTLTTSNSLENFFMILFIVSLRSQNSL